MEAQKELELQKMRARMVDDAESERQRLIEDEARREAEEEAERQRLAAILSENKRKIEEQQRERDAEQQRKSKVPIARHRASPGAGGRGAAGRRPDAGGWPRLPRTPAT